MVKSNPVVTSEGLKGCPLVTVPTNVGVLFGRVAAKVENDLGECLVHVQLNWRTPGVETSVSESMPSAAFKVGRELYRAIRVNDWIQFTGDVLIFDEDDAA